MRYAKAVGKEICFTLEDDFIHEKTHRKEWSQNCKFTIIIFIAKTYQI